MVGPVEIRVGQIGAVEARLLEARFVEARVGEARVGEARVGEARVVEVDVGEVDVGEVAADIGKVRGGRDMGVDRQNRLTVR